MPFWVDKLLNSQYVQLGLAALAFLIALWLVIVIARLLMGGRLRLPGGRTRQARLGIVDAFDLDRQRQLIIVRRDNTEHLIMIGGPNDLVIESEIVRVEARETRDARREKGYDSFNDARVPAPFAPGIAAPSIGGASRQEEPLLPLTLPQATQPIETPAPPDEAPARSEPPVRAPTFPLPPRRPVQPERRPLSTGPDRAAPRIEPPPIADLPVLPEGPATPARPPAAPTVDPAAGGPKAEGPKIEGPTVTPPLARPMPFLKPLPPRAPLRPLKRVTPQAEPLAPSQLQPGQGGQPVAQGEPTDPPTDRPRTTAPPTVGPASAEPPRAGAPAAGEADGLASLEEEMAKLLGR